MTFVTEVDAGWAVNSGFSTHTPSSAKGLPAMNMIQRLIKAINEKDSIPHKQRASVCQSIRGSQGRCDDFQ
jgi:hypothetical protein